MKTKGRHVEPHNAGLITGTYQSMHFQSGTDPENTINKSLFPTAVLADVTFLFVTHLRTHQKLLTLIQAGFNFHFRLLRAAGIRSVGFHSP